MSVAKILGALGLAWALCTGSAFAATQSDPDQYVLYAGKNQPVGTMYVWDDGVNLYVSYTTYPGECVDEAHLWVGNNLETAPGGGVSRPPPGQMPYKDDPDGCVTSGEFDPIPLVDVIADTGGVVCSQTLYVMLHAAMGSGETAYGGNTCVNCGNQGGGQGGPGNNAWFRYATYVTNSCDNPDPPPPPDFVCGTAFGKGDELPGSYGPWVFTKDPKSNPEGLMSLNLTKNRWGWAYYVTPGVYELDLWVGAGLNYTSKGTFVGTVTINWDGSVVDVTYQVLPGLYINEAHLYASVLAPTKLAPGLYGNTAPLIDDDTYAFEDISLTGTSAWFIAHAVVCTPTEPPPQ